MMDEWRTDICPGYASKTYKRGNCTIILHRPIMTAEETAARERQVKEALEAVLGEYISRKQREAMAK